MRGKLLFALIFAAGLWAGLQLFAHTQTQQASLPLETRVALRAAPPVRTQTADSPAPRAVSARAAALSLHPLCAPCAPALTAPHYRACWQAFHLQGSAG